MNKVSDLLSKSIIALNYAPKYNEEKQLLFIGSEFNVDTNTTIASLWGDEDEFLRILFDNTFETYKENSELGFSGVDNTNYITADETYFSMYSNNNLKYRATCESYLNMSDEIKLKVEHLTFKDKIFAWAYDNDNLILFVAGNT